MRSDTVHIDCFLNYFPFGQIMPNRHGDDNQYRYGFNGKERLDEMEGEGNAYDFGARILDVRLGRWLSIDELTSKFPSYAPYVFAVNRPIVAIDPDGKDIIYVNGYKFMDNNNQSRDLSYQESIRTAYWDMKERNATFTTDVNTYFGEKRETSHFVNGGHSKGSLAKDRQAEGKKIGLEMINNGEIKVSTENNVMTIVMHSQGNAEGVGIAEGIIEASKAKGIDVTVNLVFLSVHQPDDIIMSDDLKKRGIQFTYANDDMKLVDPMGKISGVADANSENTNHKDEEGKDENGRKAHSDTVDGKEAMQQIKSMDADLKIYKKSNNASKDSTPAN